MIKSKIATIVILVGVGLLAMGGGYALFEHKNPVSVIAQMFVPSPQQVFGKQNLLVLVEGLDYDYNEKDEEYSTDSRSDVIWAVNLDFANKRIYELSIPRDMIATLPNGKQAKINEAQSDGGVAEAKTVIARWLGIPGFDKYVILRIDGTQDFISALGGVDVDVKSSDCFRYHTGCSNERLDYDDNWGHLHIHLKEGMQHLNGAQALAYMRYREDWCSDPCRILRQQAVLRALVAKVRGDRLNTMMHIAPLLAAFRKNVQSDITDSQALSIATYYQGAPNLAIVSNQVPYTSDVDLAGSGDSLVPDTQARAQLVQAMLIAPPAPPPDARALAQIPAATLRVDVENGSAIAGAAHRVAARLKQAGFQIGHVGNADRSDYDRTEIHQHSNLALAAAKVASALPQGARGAAVVPDPSPSTADVADAGQSDVTVIVGNDFATWPQR